eukprot:SM000045S16172  [mRNA]  locus=s45:78306:80432:- [translate_table: standard]
MSLAGGRGHAVHVHGQAQLDALEVLLVLLLLPPSGLPLLPPLFSKHLVLVTTAAFHILASQRERPPPFLPSLLSLRSTRRTLTNTLTCCLQVEETLVMEKVLELPLELCHFVQALFFQAYPLAPPVTTRNTGSIIQNDVQKFLVRTPKAATCPG